MANPSNMDVLEGILKHYDSADGFIPGQPSGKVIRVCSVSQRLFFTKHHR